MAKDIEESPSTHPKGPARLTVYPASIVKAHDSNDVGIFFPEKYVPSGTLDLLVYFHGLPTPCGGHNSDKIWDFWRSSTFLMGRVGEQEQEECGPGGPAARGHGRLASRHGRG